MICSYIKNLLDNFRYYQKKKKKLKNSDIKTFKRSKNINEKLSTFEFEFKLNLLGK